MLTSFPSLSMKILTTKIKSLQKIALQIALKGANIPKRKASLMNNMPIYNLLQIRHTRALFQLIIRYLRYLSLNSIEYNVYKITFLKAITLV